MRKRIAAIVAVPVTAILLLACATSKPAPETAAGNELLIDVQSMIADLARYSPHHADALRRAIHDDPIVYFRMVNVEWASAVCAAFTDQYTRLPTVSLHGDAHLAQYALNATERGLDDFDDAVHGPAVLDMVRFLGSVELAVRRPGWEGERERLFETFFSGYATGLQDVSYIPPEPWIVHRMRERNTRTREGFLAWAESLMEPPPEELRRTFQRSLGQLAVSYQVLRPDLPPYYFDMKSAGLIRLGIGSARTPKALFRLEGESLDPVDDLIVEGKALSDVSAIGCVTLPATGEVYRVISGNDQVGRLSHEIMAVAPRFDGDSAGLRDAWVRSWEASFQEIPIDAYQSADELAEVVHDAGAQLGAGAIRRRALPVDQQKAAAQLALNEELRPRITQTAIKLTNTLVEAWEIVRRQQIAD